MSGASVPVSVVVLCRNEAVNLPRCLAAVRSCAEVVVVDDGSRDGSPELAAAAGARVVSHRFESFAAQRNWAMACAELRQDWVLHLDADEVVTEAVVEEFRTLLPTLLPRQTGFLARKVMLEERWLRHSADYPVYVPRLVHREGSRFVMRGHGEVMHVPEGDAVFLNAPLLHFVVSKGWDDWWARHRRYARAEACRIVAGLPPISLRALRSRDRTVRRGVLRTLSYRLPGRPVLRFLYAYVLRRGFLDGRPGFQFCRAMAHYERMIDAELKTLRSGGTTPCTPSS